MVRRFILDVARLAVCRPCQSVIKMDFSPIIAGMTGGAISCKMRDRLRACMTGLAGRGCAGIPASSVTALTGQFGVPASEGEEGMQSSCAAGREQYGVLGDYGQAVRIRCSSLVCEERKNRLVSLNLRKPSVCSSCHAEQGLQGKDFLL